MNTNPSHPRVAVSGLCFPTLSAVDAVEATGRLGVAKTSMSSSKLREAGAESVLAACRQHGVDVVTTTGLVRFDLTPGADVTAQVERAREDIDQAAAVGATSVYTLTGRRVFDDWAGNVDAYVTLVGDLVDYAASKQVVIAVEPTNWLYADLNFVHTFHDAVALASRAGMHVCLDIFHVWTEGELREDLTRNIHLVSHVQISDMEPGARELPCRDMPGQGHVPIMAIMQWVLDAGYEGVFDLELSGPRIEAIGHREAAGRAAEWLSEALVALGA